ncbi:MAG: ABC transporter substrate-binding protein [Deltaproteobacteria bacterium GWB2_65_81]|nr:MAG: ABC transporter substrate-binding protein [Deltaproteobacteria bacterium GWA2_65_63]OGP25972.1 MAG: ABC transporter substrate-binding protein [Deltaproteobacteria bacterium GWB2_65_81]OGP40738.1 MAG: ABC transporter substrate-binding protein [Deltaproteobacteria bacterium GWC2_66_88]
MRGMIKGASVVAAVMLAIGATTGGALAADGIKVGVLLPLTGSQAKFGEIEKRSYEMAAAEINAKGGVNGKKIELLFEDDTGKPDVGRSGVEKLISREKVPVITGGYSSSVTAAAAPVAQQFKVPFVICTGSADDVTEKGYDYVFRVNPPASEYPNAVKSFLHEVGKDVKTIALLYENSAFGQSSSKSFEADAVALGLKIVVKEGYQAGAIDFKPILTKVKAANPDMIYMVSYVMDASLLMRQSKELRINPKMFVGGGAGFTLPEFAKSAGDASDGVYSATLWVDTLPFPGAKEYASNFRKKYGSETEYHGAEAYAAMYVVADALKRAKSITPRDVRDALVKTDLKTAFGPVKFISYGKKTQQNKLDTYLVQWQKGNLEAVWPKSVATKKYIYPTPHWDKRK